VKSAPHVVAVKLVVVAMILGLHAGRAHEERGAEENDAQSKPYSSHQSVPIPGRRQPSADRGTNSP